MFDVHVSVKTALSGKRFKTIMTGKSNISSFSFLLLTLLVVGQLGVVTGAEDGVPGVGGMDVSPMYDVASF